MRSRFSARELSACSREISARVCERYLVSHYYSLLPCCRSSRRTRYSDRCPCSTCSSIKPHRCIPIWASCVSALGSTCAWRRMAISVVTSATCKDSTPSPFRFGQVSLASAVLCEIGSRHVISRPTTREISVWEGTKWFSYLPTHREISALGREISALGS